VKGQKEKKRDERSKKKVLGGTKRWVRNSGTDPKKSKKKTYGRGKIYYRTKWSEKANKGTWTGGPVKTVLLKVNGTR